MSQRLAETQDSFAHYIVGDSDKIADSIDGRFRHRLSIYRNNFLLNGEETLSQVFPVTRMVLGPKRFFALSTAYVEAYPALSPSRELWGDKFPDFAFAEQEKFGLAFLGDLARFELCLFESSNAPALRPLTLDDLQVVAGGNEREFRFALVPSVRLLESQFRIDALYEAHSSGKIEIVSSFDLLQESCCLATFQRAGRASYVALEREIFDFAFRLSQEGWREDIVAALGIKRSTESLLFLIERGMIRREP